MIAGLILAAGESSRMGRPKALLTYRRRTFLETAIQTLQDAGAHRTVVVLGHHAEEIRQAVRFDKVETVVNSDYRLGQTSSLQAGLRSLQISQTRDTAAAISPSPLPHTASEGGASAISKDELDAVVLALVDHPAVTVETIRKLVVCFLTSHASVVIPKYQNQRGHPIIIARALFPELLTLGPEEGANTVIRKYRDATRFVEVNDPGILLDVDDPETYRNLNP
jgi:molybdenum cofactor cytidylyltransferase